MATGESELNWQETPHAWIVGHSVQPPKDKNNTRTAGGKHGTVAGPLVLRD